MSILSALAPASVFLSSTAVLFGMLDPTILDEKPTYTDRFTAKDHSAFDRAFELHGTTCDVGIAHKKICFGTSPFEDEIEIGAPLPAHAPIMPASIPVILRTSLKPSEYSTYRYGKTLVLIEDETRMVVDTLDLKAEYPAPNRQQDQTRYAGMVTTVSITSK